MSTPRLVLEGFTELVNQLHQLPAEIKAQGFAIVKDEAQRAADEIRAAYPPGPTGTLKRRVKVDVPSSTVIIAIVLSTAPHAHLYEFGTEIRKTRQGWNRGAMWKEPGKPHPVTVPIARRRRAEMERRLADLVRAQGFEVTGV